MRYLRTIPINKTCGAILKLEVELQINLQRHFCRVTVPTNHVSDSNRIFLSNFQLLPLTSQLADNKINLLYLMYFSSYYIASVRALRIKLFFVSRPYSNDKVGNIFGNRKPNVYGVLIVNVKPNNNYLS